ncbi:growth hormone-releasing hormone receptor isoform X2 [Oxyura jamaicensis]|uniref:growth hormone-releasing hormone receptor isoform X2 n=1 Tax=Oxyura jamaicensis TaxID=8884 RepID=UPI0015A5C64D|nr:growth hormone-releasing hormone receptor isoform X2 [Oxyura jamaicensis]
MDSSMLYHCVLYTLTLAVFVAGNVHPECDFITELKKKEAECLEESEKHGNATTGCKRTWDKLLCWPEADAGETLALPCPDILFHFMKETAGIVRRNCTKKGWSDPFPSYHIACPVEDEIPLEEQSYFSTIKIIYTVGYSVSITSLIIAVAVLIAFRRLRCPRNYIHIQLFFTFILKAIAIFIKDSVLFQEEDIDHCSFSTTECKISVVFCHYFMMTNFMWLLVEALYLNCLLLSSLSHGKRYFWWLVLFGWGFPTLFTLIWILAKFYFEDTECWDINQGSPYWWLIKGPIIISVGTSLKVNSPSNSFIWNPLYCLQFSSGIHQPGGSALFRALHWIFSGVYCSSSLLFPEPRGTNGNWPKVAW